MGFRDVGSILEEVAARRPGWKRRMGYSVIWDSWKDLVGEGVAKNAFPEKIVESSVLVVRVADSTWMQQLFMERYNLLTRINMRLPRPLKLRDIRFRHGELEGLGPPPSKGPKVEPYPEAAPNGPPEDLLKEAEAITQDIKDQDLRDRLMRAYIAFKLRKAHLGRQ